MKIDSAGLVRVPQFGVLSHFNGCHVAMIPIKTDSNWKGTADCCNCGLRELGLFADLNEHDLSLFRAPIDALELRAGSVLYGESEQALGVFTLRSGMIKLVRMTADGRERVVRVLRPMDAVGLEALATAHYDSAAVALTDIALCRIPLSVIHTLSTKSPRMHKRLMGKWQCALKDADDWLADLNFGTARQRVAHFILKMRNPGDPLMATLFSREDMGAMLDLKLETVSRELSQLKRAKVIEPMDRHRRLYRIQDVAALQAI